MKRLGVAITERRLMGELDHPTQDAVKLHNVSHLVTVLEMRGNEMYGEAEILNTPCGQVAQALIKGGVKLGISSRGLGSVSEQMGKTIVEDDFQLICFDFVSEPSTSGAFMMTEGEDANLDKVFTKADKINRALNEILRDKE